MSVRLIILIIVHLEAICQEFKFIIDNLGVARNEAQKGLKNGLHGEGMTTWTFGLDRRNNVIWFLSFVVFIFFVEINFSENFKRKSLE